jgi:putative spermidine/putrescine transport system permease protein
MARIASNAFAALVAAFFVLPILAVIPAAFNRPSFIKLPPDEWSLRWWSTFFADPSWRRALETSLTVATLSAVIAVIVGVAAALGLARLSGGLRAVVTGAFLGPAIVPVIVLAVSLYGSVRSLGLLGTITGLVLAHAMLGLPYVVLNTGVSLSSLDPKLKLAAAGLGADPWRIFHTVTLPQIIPGIAGGAIFSFVTSFDEVVLSIFLTSPSMKTLPVRMWEDIRVEYVPTVAVAATIMIAIAITAGLASRLLFRR